MTDEEIYKEVILRLVEMMYNHESVIVHKRAGHYTAWVHERCVPSISDALPVRELRHYDSTDKTDAIVRCVMGQINRK